jgi:hypothetical protein
MERQGCLSDAEVMYRRELAILEASLDLSHFFVGTSSLAVRSNVPNMHQAFALQSPQNRCKVVVDMLLQNLPNIEPDVQERMGVEEPFWRRAWDVQASHDEVMGVDLYLEACFVLHSLAPQKREILHIISPFLVCKSSVCNFKQLELEHLAKIVAEHSLAYDGSRARLGSVDRSQQAEVEARPRPCQSSALQACGMRHA